MCRDYPGQDVGRDGIERKKDDNKNTQVPDLRSWAGCCKTIHCYRDVMTVAWVQYNCAEFEGCVRYRRPSYSWYHI